MTIADVYTVEKLASPTESAKAIGLKYVSTDHHGIRRVRKGTGFVYRLDSGQVVCDRQTMARIRSLAIPPAWSDVWICRNPDGHLQATGRDARRRKQHRYHPKWREIRDAAKYSRLVAFAKSLPGIRRRVAKDLKQRGLQRDKVLAAVVRLLEVSLVRVGNDEYAKANNSFGLTTMKDRHVQIKGTKLRFQFRGKSGINHQVDIQDQRLAKVVKSCQELPGQELFQYVDDEGRQQDVKSGDVNDYLRQISGAEFSAKDFRTWAGTVLAAMALAEFKKFDSQTEAKKNIVRAIESVAKKLGNTSAICRKCYVHPDVIEAYLDGKLIKALKQRAEQQLTRSLRRLSAGETAVLALLQQKLADEENNARRSDRTRTHSGRERFTGSTAPQSRRRNKKAFHPRSVPRA